MELREGQHMGVVTYPFSMWAPPLLKYLFSLGMNCNDPSSTSWSSAIIRITLGRRCGLGLDEGWEDEKRLRIADDMEDEDDVEADRNADTRGPVCCCRLKDLRRRSVAFKGRHLVFLRRLTCRRLPPLFRPPFLSHRRSPKVSRNEGQSED